MQIINLTECPRDAMQGLHHFVPTALKAEYINSLLQVGFDTIDFGSFVSPKAIPQMRDTAEVLAQLNISNSLSKLLVIVANLRGAQNAAHFEEITYLGFPFSISETFQQRNTNSSITQSFTTVQEIQKLCLSTNKQLIVYLSMGFGNPYGDVWNTEIVSHWASKLIDEGIRIISLADTTGVSTPEKIELIYPSLVSQFLNTEFGVHLHSTPYTSAEKLRAAFDSGCRRFDSALKGYGGCPMAADDLTGNIATEKVIEFMTDQGLNLNLNMEKWNEALKISNRVFV